LFGGWIGTSQTDISSKERNYCATNGNPVDPKSDNQTADAIIADCDGDPRAAVIEPPAIIRSLIHENQLLREAASPGFARRRPIVFGKLE
jgi:hypothetical protein